MDDLDEPRENLGGQDSGSLAAICVELQSAQSLAHGALTGGLGGVEMKATELGFILRRQLKNSLVHSTVEGALWSAHGEPLLALRPCWC